MEVGEAPSADAELYHAVGRAISAWSLVEQGLTSVFGATLGPSLTLKSGGFIGAGGAVFAVFYAIENQRSRIAMIDAALEAAIDKSTAESKEVLDLWARAKARTLKLGVARNRLAHWSVSWVGQLDGSQQARLVPPFFDSRRAHQGIAVHDVAGWEREFLRLADDEIAPVTAALGRHQGLRYHHANGIAAMVHNLHVDGRDDEADQLLSWLTQHASFETQAAGIE